MNCSLGDVCADQYAVCNPLSNVCECISPTFENSDGQCQLRKYFKLVILYSINDFFFQTISILPQKSFIEN